MKIIDTNRNRKKTEGLTGRQLDYVVALALGHKNISYDGLGTWWVKLNGKDRAIGNSSWAQAFCPSTDWRHGGEIIEGLDGFQLKIWVESQPASKCEAHIHNQEGDWVAFGETPLIAAMRCFAISKVGEVVDLPAGL